MNTKSARVLRGIAAAVSGARHVRVGRNGQDAAKVWLADESAGYAVDGCAGGVVETPVVEAAPVGTVVDEGARGVGLVVASSRVAALPRRTISGGVGAIVVCDGCGSGASSEVGARLGAELVIGALARQLVGAALGSVRLEPALFDDVRAEVVAAIDVLVGAMHGEREQIVHDYFLFTTVAAVMIGDEVVVWAIGDGAYAIDGRVRELGPFEDNQPPYLAYDLLGNPQVAHVEIARGNSVIVATDGAAEIGFDHFAGVDRFVAHPDALRRQLAILARGAERIDWDARRVVRTPALLQDDGAVAMLVRGTARDGGAS